MVAPLPAIQPNQRPSVCGPCGGECCHTRPGVEAPDRFLAAPDPAAALADALRSGDWVLLEHHGLPWVDGNPPSPRDAGRVVSYPRPATLAERASGRVFDGPERSPCVFLGSGGCRLSFAERPRMCQSLEPHAAGECEAAWDRRAAALAWAPWQDLVSEAKRRCSLRPGGAG
ncbi:MAG TPA: hypothetical protein VFR85_15085 [Anaeromyxobacteraceae bacterium]|nr:hypothetical protein [Anaeromyxobacteraceae bacterium]